MRWYKLESYTITCSSCASLQLLLLDNSNAHDIVLTFQKLLKMQVSKYIYIVSKYKVSLRHCLSFQERGFIFLIPSALLYFFFRHIIKLMTFNDNVLYLICLDL